VERDTGARKIVPVQLNIEEEHKIKGMEIHLCTCHNEKCSMCTDQLVVLPQLDMKKCFQVPAQTATAVSKQSELVVLKLCPEEVGRQLKSKLVQVKRQKT